MMKRIPRCLTIAGSDSGGGAGIQADLKTFEALGCFGMSAITAITAQNAFRVQSIQELDPQIVADQIDVVIEGIGVDIAKTGMLSGQKTVAIVAAKVKGYGLPTVVDPIMASESGSRLLREDAVSSLKELLFPQALLALPIWSSLGRRGRFCPQFSRSSQRGGTV